MAGCGRSEGVHVGRNAIACTRINAAHQRTATGNLFCSCYSYTCFVFLLSFLRVAAAIHGTAGRGQRKGYKHTWTGCEHHCVFGDLA